MCNTDSKSLDESIFEGFAKLILQTLSDEITITNSEYKSAVQASREVLVLISVTLLTTWIADFTISYRLPHAAYGIALSGSASVLFAGTDIFEVINEEIDSTVAGENIESPAIYGVVRRLGGLIFFVSGFFIQLLALYYESIIQGPIFSNQIHHLTLPLIGILTVEKIYNTLLFVITVIGCLYGLKTQRIVIEITKTVAAVFGIVIIAVIAQTFIGTVVAQIITVVMIFVVQVFYLGVILVNLSKGVMWGIRAARQSKKEVVDEGQMEDNKDSNTTPKTNLESGDTDDDETIESNSGESNNNDGTNGNNGDDE